MHYLPKYSRATVLLVAFIFALSSCMVHRPHHRGHHPPGQTQRMYKGKKAKPIPPGQKKKIYRQQSAKPFAPGQQK